MFGFRVSGFHLDLLRPHVWEGRRQQVGHVFVDEGEVVGVGGGAAGCRGHIPQRRLYDVGADHAEQVVQQPRVHLQARLVERVCAERQTGRRARGLPLAHMSGRAPSPVCLSVCALPASACDARPRSRQTDTNGQAETSAGVAILRDSVQLCSRDPAAPTGRARKT
jgi:hypothetical protein